MKTYSHAVSAETNQKHAGTLANLFLREFATNVHSPEENRVKGWCTEEKLTCFANQRITFNIFSGVAFKRPMRKIPTLKCDTSLPRFGPDAGRTDLVNYIYNYRCMAHEKDLTAVKYSPITARRPSHESRSDIEKTLGQLWSTRAWYRSWQHF